MGRSLGRKEYDRGRVRVRFGSSSGPNNLLIYWDEIGRTIPSKRKILFADESHFAVGDFFVTHVPTHNFGIQIRIGRRRGRGSRGGRGAGGGRWLCFIIVGGVVGVVASDVGIVV